MFDIEKILQTSDLRQLVERAGGEVDNHGRCACVLHGGDNSSAFSIFHKDGKDLWKCHTGDCGGGDVITFVQKWQGLDFRGACAFLGGDVASDPVALEASAKERLARSIIEHEATRLKMEARQHELQKGNKHNWYHDQRGDWARKAWTARGLDEGLQDFFTLGACDNFSLSAEYTTPTLTIPIFSADMELLNIKHRLINPMKPKDKYRPETSGLGAFPPLLATPGLGYDGGLIIVVEGEIKAMVTWSRLDIQDFQVIGVGGKGMFSRLTENLIGKNVLVIPDPDGEKEAFELARKVGGRVLEMPAKIDDYLLANNVRGDAFYRLIKQARKVSA